MEIEILAYSWEPDREDFPIAAARKALKNVDVVDVREHLIGDGARSTLLLLLVKRSSKRQRSTNERWVGGREDPEDSVSAGDIPLFRNLRTWRNQKAETEQVPNYVIFLNKQLAEIASLHPRTLADLKKIDGVGIKKCERYGEEILAIVESFPGNAPKLSTVNTEDSGELIS